MDHQHLQGGFSVMHALNLSAAIMVVVGFAGGRCEAGLPHHLVGHWASNDSTETCDVHPSGLVIYRQRIGSPEFAERIGWASAPDSKSVGMGGTWIYSAGKHGHNSNGVFALLVNSTDHELDATFVRRNGLPGDGSFHSKLPKTKQAPASPPLTFTSPLTGWWNGKVVESAPGTPVAIGDAFQFTSAGFGVSGSSGQRRMLFSGVTVYKNKDELAAGQEWVGHWIELGSQREGTFRCSVAGPKSLSGELYERRDQDGKTTYASYEFKADGAF